MRIGMLTFHSAFNYGAFLQTYSLYQVLKRTGHDVSVIDYCPDYLIRPYLPIHRFDYNPHQTVFYNLYRLFGTLLIDLLNFRQSVNRKKYFNQSLNHHFQYSKERRLISAEELHHCESYDLYIAGSDQIWNPNITAGALDSVYFLSFVNEMSRKAVYGASMKTSVLPLRHLDDFKKYLMNLDYISLRECSAVPFVEELAESDVSCVLDPSLLLSKEEWSDFSETPLSCPKKYLVSYYLGRDRTYIEKVKKIARNSGLDIVWIDTKSVFHRISRKNYVSPEEFVWYFKHASAVVTDSFHGTLFSVLFQIPFYAVAPYPQSVRIQDHLKRLGLEDRFYLSVSDVPDVMADLDYADSYDRLQDLRASSFEFLNRVLES